MMNWQKMKNKTRTDGFNIPGNDAIIVSVWDCTQHLYLVKDFSVPRITRYIIVDKYFKRPINNIKYESLQDALSTAQWISSSVDAMLGYTQSKDDLLHNPTASSLMYHFATMLQLRLGNVREVLSEV